MGFNTISLPDGISQFKRKAKRYKVRSNRSAGTAVYRFPIMENEEVVAQLKKNATDLCLSKGYDVESFVNKVMEAFGNLYANRFELTKDIEEITNLKKDIPNVYNLVNTKTYNAILEKEGIKLTPPQTIMATLFSFTKSQFNSVIFGNINSMQNFINFLTYDIKERIYASNKVYKIKARVKRGENEVNVRSILLQTLMESILLNTKQIRSLVNAPELEFAHCVVESKVNIFNGDEEINVLYNDRYVTKNYVQALRILRYLVKFFAPRVDGKIVMLPVTQDYRGVLESYGRENIEALMHVVSVLVKYNELKINADKGLYANIFFLDQSSGKEVNDTPSEAIEEVNENDVDSYETNIPAPEEDCDAVDHSEAPEQYTFEKDVNGIGIEQEIDLEQLEFEEDKEEDKGEDLELNFHNESNTTFVFERNEEETVDVTSPHPVGE